jgi:peptidoglycan DL-endopeptidase CwlO
VTGHALISGQRRLRRTLPLLLVVSAAVMAVGLSPALGGSGPTPSSRSQTLAAREHTALLDLYASESGLARARANVAETRNRLAAVGRERQSVARRAALVRASLRAAQTRVGQAVRDLYILGQPDIVAIFLGATSLDQAFSAVDTVKRTGAQNRALIAEMHHTQASLHAVDAALAARSNELETVRAGAEASVAQLQTAVEQRAALASSLRRQQDITSRAAARLEQEARAAQQRSARIAVPPPVPTRASQPTPAPTPPGAATTTAEPPTPTPGPSASTPSATGTRTLVVSAVAYHLPGYTASGLPVGVGVIAVDPRVIPLGTRVFVPGYGPAVAADVGSAVIGNIIDLWMPSDAKARAWGRRIVTITIYG